MTRKEAMRQAAQENALLSLGFTRDESEQLRRISMTLHRWHEGECGIDHRCIVRGRKEGGKFIHADNGGAYWQCAGVTVGTAYYPTPDRERGALRRLKSIIGQRNGRPAIVNGRLNAAPSGPVAYYIQGDPRGAALYILRPGDVLPGESADSCYSRGICVY